MDDEIRAPEDTVTEQLLPSQERETKEHEETDPAILQAMQESLKIYQEDEMYRAQIESCLTQQAQERAGVEAEWRQIVAARKAEMETVFNDPRTRRLLVYSEYPDETKDILRSIMDYCLTEGESDQPEKPEIRTYPLLDSLEALLNEEEFSSLKPFIRLSEYDRIPQGHEEDEEKDEDEDEEMDLNEG